MREQNFRNSIIRTAFGCIIFAAAMNQSFADSLTELGIQLTDEQTQLLYGKNTINHQINSAFLSPHAQNTIVSLVSLNLTADINIMKGYSLDIGAVYKSWGLSRDFNQITYSTIETEFTIQAPIQAALDFSEEIRSKVEYCPEKALEKLLVDGALALNVSW